MEQAEASFAHSLAQQALFRGGAFLRIASLVVGDAIRSGEMPSNRREDHEVSMLALHLLQKDMVYINTLIISSDQPLRGGAQQPVAERVNDFETPMHINLVSMDRAFSSASSPAWVG